MKKLTQEQLDFYNEEGYLHIPGFYSIEDIKNINVASQECPKTKGVEVIYEEDGETVRSIMSYHDKIEVLDHYTRDKKIMDVVDDLVKEPVYVSQSKINIKKGSAKGKKWDIHRGFTYWNLLDGMPKTDMISAFVYLTDQTVENGAVFGIPKSHQNVGVETVKEESDITGGREKDTAADLSIQIKDKYVKQFMEEGEIEYFTGKAGDLLIMHSCLLHASKANTTQQSRGLMITVYNPVNNLPANSNRAEFVCEKCNGPITPFSFELSEASVAE